MKKWMENRMLRAAYWLLWKVRGPHHSLAFDAHINDIQRDLAEVITIYYER